MSFPTQMRNRVLSAGCALFICHGAAYAQGTLADYQRGQELTRRAGTLVTGTPGTPNWIGETAHFWYTKSAKGGSEFLLVDATAATTKMT